MVDYDSPWKEALDAFLQPCLELLFPRVHVEIDWYRGYESLDTELRQVAADAQSGPRVVDKLVRVWRITGAEEWVLVHIEVQSQPEAEFARRMYTYNYRLFDRYNRAVVSLAVLGDERSSWRPQRFRQDLWGCGVRFYFPIVKLLDFADRVEELESHPNPFALLVLAHLKAQQTRRDPANRFTWKMRLIRGLLERGQQPEQIRQWLRFVDWLLALPVELERQCRDEVHRLAEEKKMPFITSFERLAKEEGVQVGREEGREEGREAGLKHGIQTALELRFGHDGLDVFPEIDRISRPDVLESILQSIKTARSVDELRESLRQQ